MPAGVIGSCWRAGTWSDTTWEADSWAAGASVVLLPTNIIVATQTVSDVKRRISVTEVDRTIAVAHAQRTVTFDG